MKKYFKIAFFLLISILHVYSQESIKTVGYEKYIKHDGNWYTYDGTRKGDLVDSKHIIVRLINGGPINNFNFSKFGLNKYKIVRGPYAGGFYELLVPENRDPFLIGKKLISTNAFEYVFLNTFSIISSQTPNDPYFTNSSDYHWNLKKIKMEDVWAITTGSVNVKVAIVDYGVDYNHPDLNNNIGSSLYNFIDDDDDPFPYGGAYHGTAVSGIIGAELNNSLGVSGIAGGWGITKGVDLMVLKVGSDSIGIDNSAAAEAILWAARNGAKVINGSFNSFKSPADISSSIDSALARGTLVVFSTGNYFGSDEGI